MELVRLPKERYLSLDAAVAFIRAERRGAPVGWLGHTEPEGLDWLFPDAVHVSAESDAALPTPVVVGPDGAPFWRPARRWTIPGLEDAGIERTALLAYLADAADRSVLPFDWDALLAVNRTVLLALPSAERERRLADTLSAAGIQTGEHTPGVLWDVVAPRIRRFPDAVTFLGFLHAMPEPPIVPPEDRPQLVRLCEALETGAIHSGDALTIRLESLAQTPPDVHDLRRVLRWALTGQRVAPPVWRVWDLLGPEEAQRRLAATGGERSA